MGNRCGGEKKGEKQDGQKFESDLQKVHPHLTVTFPAS